MKILLIKQLFKVIGAWILFFLLLYIFLELAFFYYFTRVFPLSSYTNAGISAGLLLQYSKKNTYPHNYIAILGDSYAFGQGDWLLEGEHGIRPSYSAAHILYQKLKRDVVAFGLPASDSIRANNILPRLFISATQKYRREKIEKPEVIIVYFYEGNDLNDNVETAKHLIYPLFEKEDFIYHKKQFQEFVIPSLIKNNVLVQQVSKMSWSESLFFFCFAKNTIMDAYQRYQSGETMDPWKPPKKGNVTQIKVDGVVDYLPNRIQTPALSLDKQQIKLGLYIFEQSLIFLKDEFPQARIGIAYIPAVITPYDVVSPRVHDYYRDSTHLQQRNQLSSRIRNNSDSICREVREIALRNNIGFVDSRSRLRSVAKNHYVHGPIDWNHFNHLGYQTFSEDLLVLIEQLESALLGDIPECRWEI